MEEVKIKCMGSRFVKLDLLNIIQGELKELSHENYTKLKNQILEHGFVVPFAVWSKANSKDKHLDLLDGTQRLITLKKMGEEGFIIPDLFPIVDIDAPDEKSAKKILLGISSQYGEINQEGLYEFMSIADISMPEISLNFNFDAIDFDKFDNNFFKDEVPKKGKEVDLEEMEADEFIKKSVECPNCKAVFLLKQKTDPNRKG